MKNFVPLSEVENILKNLQDKVKDSLLNAIEEPMTSLEAYQFLGYSTQKAFQNDIPKYPHHRVRGKIFFYKSELNQHIKNEGLQ